MKETQWDEKQRGDKKDEDTTCSTDAICLLPNIAVVPMVKSQWLLPVVG